MATVIVHDVDEAALERLRVATAQQGGSVEAEVRAFIQAWGNAGRDVRQAETAALVNELRAYAEEMRGKYGPFDDTTEWLREDRRSW